ncbi:unnamed protein product [Closterium sp. Naga37s-1]|nr:unnamed protein product [Closterium sp. Naga37s-1]
MARSSSGAEMKEGGATAAGAAGAAGSEGSPSLSLPLPPSPSLSLPLPLPPSLSFSLLEYRHLWNMRVLLRPVLLGAILRATGNAMPSAVPARGAWLQQDIARTAAFAQLPRISVPPGFGSPRFSTLRCQRLLTALALHQGHDSPELLALTRALFTTIWTAPAPHRPPPSAHSTATTPHTASTAASSSLSSSSLSSSSLSSSSLSSSSLSSSASSPSASHSSPSDISPPPPSRSDITAPAFLRHACCRAGIPAWQQDELLAAAATPAVKHTLTASTQAAIEGGAFGVPTLFIHPTTRPVRLATGATLSPSRPLMLFGSDRYEQLAWLLGLPWHGPNPPVAAL